MCIAIYIPEGCDCSKENLENGWSNNDDGAGYCFINAENEIVIKKFMKWDAFWKDYEEDRILYAEESPFLVHFRITSKGTTNIDNCHPFRVNDDMAIIHNGTIINIDIDKKDTRSDTRIFAEEYLSSFGESIVDNYYMFDLICGYIGSSKIVLLHRDKGVFIFNEDLGIWDNEDGCWYSNNTYTYRWYSKDYVHGVSDDYYYYGRYHHDSTHTPWAKCMICETLYGNNIIKIGDRDITICAVCKKDMKSDTIKLLPFTKEEDIITPDELDSLLLQNDSLECACECERCLSSVGKIDLYWYKLLNGEKELVALCKWCANSEFYKEKKIKIVDPKAYLF